MRAQHKISTNIEKTIKHNINIEKTTNTPNAI